MNRQSRETPMDFSYDNGTGPVDANSPFMAFVNQQGQPNGKRPFSAFSNSPSKTQGNTFPSLRPAAGQKVLFSDMPPSPTRASPDKPLPQVPDRDRSLLFNTPRKLDFDFSSGGETPETPGNNADSEATPDDNMRRVFTASKNEKRESSPSKKKRQSMFSELWNRKPAKSGRGEIAPGYSNRAVDRVAKRRHKTRSKEVKKYNESPDGFDSDTERRKDSASSGSDQASSSTHWAAVASFFSYLESHPLLPHVLSYYAQLMVNVFIAFAVCYGLWSFWGAIQGDVDKASAEATAEIIAEMASCAAHYRDNGCESATRAPALSTPCSEWAKCMNRDPARVGRARVSAHTFAQIFNSFVEPISYKALFFSIFVTFGVFILINGFFGFVRRQYGPDTYPPAHGAAWVPPTPHRHPSGGLFAPYPSGTPFHGSQEQYFIAPPGQTLGLEPAPSADAERSAVASPSKQIEYR